MPHPAPTPHAAAPALTRRTLIRPASVSGVTLFSGVHATVTISPSAGPHAGIEFRRADLPAQKGGLNLIRADASRIVPESRRTVLSVDPKNPHAPTVQTVEHILSALAGMGITDALIDLDGPEVPIGDGSAKPFADACLQAGIADLDSETRGHAANRGPAPLILTKPIVFEDGPARIEAHPALRPGLELTYHLEYPPGSPIQPQSATLFIPPDQPAEGYLQNIAPARTFCLAQEAQAMRNMGLFHHLTPRQMLVVGPDGPIDNTLRFPDEPARHKLLDLLGDLSLCGRQVHARVIATRTGHAHNHMLAKALADLP